jgi:hypothetical protein
MPITHTQPIIRSVTATSKYFSTPIHLSQGSERYCIFRKSKNPKHICCVCPTKYEYLLVTTQCDPEISIYVSEGVLVNYRRQNICHETYNELRL